MTRNIFYIERVAAVVVAVILLQTLFFKFTGAQESIDLFTKLGAEPVGRIGSGVIELFAGVLLLFPKTAYTGAMLAVAVAIGALLAHIAVLGFVGDMGTLAIMAMVVLAGGMFVLLVRNKNSNYTE